MKLQINRGSWHYAIAKNGGFDQYGDAEQSDLCSYFWSLVWGCVWPLLVIAIGSIGAGVMVLAPLIGIIAFLLEGLWVWDDLPAIWLVGDIVIAAIFLVPYAFKHGGDQTAVAKLVKAGYRGWKEKTCVLVEIK